MNILFLTMNVLKNLKMHNIYSDLMEEFVRQGHRPYIVTPREKKTGEETALENHENYSLLKVQIGNTSGVSFIEKGISTVTLERKFKNSIKKYLGDVKFGLILYSTPPITLSGTIAWLKKTQKAPTYLMLKDIFPQNAVDLGMFSKKSLIYKFFRKKECRLYEISDTIGCMSPANIDYVLKHNLNVKSDKVELCPNCIEISEHNIDKMQRNDTRTRYNIPLDLKVFLYGGNLGKPQDIPFIIECLKRVENRSDCFFVFCGTGTEYSNLKKYMNENKPRNILLINGLEKSEYDNLVASCDIGLIFLDHRFTIPNFPSRLLSYMEYSMPVLACTDSNTDVGTVIVDGNFGWCCKSDDSEGFAKLINSICLEDNCIFYGNNALQYLKNHYAVSTAYNALMNKFKTWG